MRTLLLSAALARISAPTFPSLLGGFVAVGGDTIRLFKDGLVENHVPVVGYVWNDVVVANDMIVAVSYAQRRVAYKPLVGGVWTIVSPGGFIVSWRAVTFLNGKFYFLGNASYDNQRLMSTADFITWGSITFTDSTNLTHYKLNTYGNELLVAPQVANRVKSVDSITGAITSYDCNFGAASYYPTSFKVVNGVPFVCGQARKISKGAIVNGIIQYEMPKVSGAADGTSAFIREIEYSAALGKYIGVGSGGAGNGSSPLLYTSVDGTTWVTDTDIGTAVGATNGIQSMVIDDDDIYMGCNDGKVFKTTDLINYSLFSTLPAHVFNMKAY